MHAHNPAVFKLLAFQNRQMVNYDNMRLEIIGGDVTRDNETINKPFLLTVAD